MLHLKTIVATACASLVNDPGQPEPFTTTHARERSRAPISALRLLDGVTESTSSARLDLGRSVLAQDNLRVPATIAASARMLHLRTIVATACASLVNEPG